VSYSEAGGRTLETQSLERMDADGYYQPNLDIEKETIRVDSNTVRIVERSYARDQDNGRQLVQVADAQILALAEGAVKTVRTTSKADGNGRLQAVEREVEMSKQISPDVKRTTTSIFTLASEGWREIVRTEQRETRIGNSVEFQNTTLVPDFNGGWKTSEVRQRVAKEDGTQPAEEENVLRPEFDGKVSVAERTTKRETILASGEKQAITETYSVDLPGEARDGKLHLVERVTAVGRMGQDGQQSMQVTIENPNPGSPRDEMRVAGETLDVVVRGGDGKAHETRSAKEIDANGNLTVVRVDIGTSDKPEQ
jgi:hypothetical protein